MSGAPEVAAVTYDFWNTIFAQSPAAYEARLAANVTLLGDAGHHVREATMRQAMGSASRWYTDRWQRNIQSTPRDAVRRLLEILDVEATPGVVASLVDVIVTGSDPASMAPAAGIGTVLEEWQRRGVRLGIICDVGITPSTTLRRYLDHHGLLDYFDHMAFSDEVGHYKPHPEIFESAGRGLEVPGPDRVAHVGDLVRTDVAGARTAGWHAVRYRGLSDDQEGLAATGIDGHHVIDSHVDLLDIFG